jgi:hypothetical protein
MNGIDLIVGQRVEITTVTDGVKKVICGFFAGADCETYVLRSNSGSSRGNKVFINREKVTFVKVFPIKGRLVSPKLTGRRVTSPSSKAG